MNQSFKVHLWVYVTLNCLIQLSCENIQSYPIASSNGENVVLPNGSIFTRTSLLKSFGLCVIKELETFEEQSHRFAAIASESVNNPSQYASAKEAWQDTIDIWQQLEVMQIGPSDKSTKPGGLGLRDSIYAWPLSNECAVDSYLLSEAYQDESAMLRFSANGLSAAEYLIFYGEDNNACDQNHEINIDGAWDSLEEELLFLRRSSYAAFTANAVAETATSLLNEWLPTGENFLEELIQAGNGSRTYGKKRVAINAVSDALAYIEWAVKDSKLAKPLGLRDCDQEFCIDLVESKYGRRSKEHLKNNLIGFRKIFKGCDINYSGLGFDDYLLAIGQPQLAEQMDKAVLSTITAIDALNEKDLVTALETDKDSVLAIYRSLDQLTDLLRSDFLIALNLELPVMVQGDND